MSINGCFWKKDLPAKKAETNGFYGLQEESDGDRWPIESRFAPITRDADEIERSKMARDDEDRFSALVRQCGGETGNLPPHLSALNTQQGAASSSTMSRQSRPGIDHYLCHSPTAVLGCS